MAEINSSPTNTSFSVGFIGGGNMARSIIGGLTAGTKSSIKLQVYDQSTDTLTELANHFDITPATSNQQIVEQCDVVVLAVKPQVMQSVLSALDANQTQAVFLSIAAGLKISSLAKWLDSEVAIIRAMPNTPALVQCGASGLYANQQVSVQQKEYADIVMQATGIALWVDSEDLLDSVTALSGSGPAYFFLVMEAMQAAAEKLGLNTETAKQLTLQTALGAATLASQSSDSPATLRQRVTSPGGTTEQAINTLVDNQLIEIFGKAMQAAYDRSKQLAVELDQK
ncbi:Pyrroline-5-carboxylate reductase [hydrothermal vent metagenome]|uniref:Pyrroline-5-carboxylate reductase n=1 Tax=hydrothermal vent metagenome TaxID=652676 RepID=A0A3B1ACX8_9ZZZZ